MTQEHKDLLLKDLCARLPYGVKIDNIGVPCKLASINNKYRIIVEDIAGYKNPSFDLPKLDVLEIEDANPYLFPLSSMTEKQKQEYAYIVNYISSDDTENWKEGEFIYVEQFTQLMHFYHINHLDYMGLIPMGLAIDATGLNIY